MQNVVTAPKTDSYHFRINPEVRKEVEEVYAQCGLTFTQAINMFIQQSLNVGGLPFEVRQGPDKADKEARKIWALGRLMEEIEKGKNSPLIDEEEAYLRLGVDPR